MRTDLKPDFPVKLYTYPKHQTRINAPLVKYTLGLHYAFFSVWSHNKTDLQFWFSVKTVTDLNWDQAIQESQLSPIENTAL